MVCETTVTVVVFVNGVINTEAITVGHCGNAFGFNKSSPRPEIINLIFMKSDGTSGVHLYS